VKTYLHRSFTSLLGLLSNRPACRTRPVSRPEREENLLQVFVRDNNIEQALRVLKKKMQREGVFREMRRRRFYEKPSEEAARKKSDAVRRMRKLARKQAIREGLIAAPPKKKKEDAKRPGIAAGAA
jgi:small subunit ribosomal protein S21